MCTRVRLPTGTPTFVNCEESLVKSPSGRATRGVYVEELTPVTRRHLLRRIGDPLVPGCKLHLRVIQSATTTDRRQGTLALSQGKPALAGDRNVPVRLLFDRARHR